MTPPSSGALTKNDYAYAQLRELILTGKLEPGSRIDQGALSRELGVSTTPLREAIRRLSGEGMVLLSAHRDVRVSTVSAAEATHLFEVRATLDPLAAGLAAERRSEDDLRMIRDAAAQLVPLTDLGDATAPEALDAHRKFHRAIYTASRNPILIDELERLWDKADRYRLIGLRSRRDSGKDAARIDGEHRSIVAAIGDGDGTLAADLMRRHIEGSLGRRAIDALSENL